MVALERNVVVFSALSIVFFSAPHADAKIPFQKRSFRCGGAGDVAQMTENSLGMSRSTTPAAYELKARNSLDVALQSKDSSDMAAIFEHVNQFGKTDSRDATRTASASTGDIRKADDRETTFSSTRDIHIASSSKRSGWLAALDRMETKAAIWPSRLISNKSKEFPAKYLFILRVAIEPYLEKDPDSYRVAYQALQLLSSYYHREKGFKKEAARAAFTELLNRLRPELKETFKDTHIETFHLKTHLGNDKLMSYDFRT